MNESTQSVVCNREGTDRTLVIATASAMLTLIPVAAHQLQILSHLPDPPQSLFASDEITESSSAHPMGIPDGLLGLGSYSITLTLAVFADHPRARKLLAAKLVADGALASVNVVRQVLTFGKLCSWCTGTAICTAFMVLAGRKLIAAEIHDWVNSDRT